MFEDKRVTDVDSLEEFNKKYYKRERYEDQGIGYMQTVLQSQRESIDEHGYAIISPHDNVTGDVVAYFEEYPDNELREEWLQIGKSNAWISKASDPAFTKNCFHKCETKSGLKAKLLFGNWGLGQAFYWNNICFINQVNAGDEWVVIKDDYDFESINAIPMIKQGRFMDFLEQVREASKEDLKALKY